jgi:hypothetical protein
LVAAKKKLKRKNPSQNAKNAFALSASATLTAFAVARLAIANINPKAAEIIPDMIISTTKAEITTAALAEAAHAKAFLYRL